MFITRARGPRPHFFNLASDSPHIVYQEYICQYLGDVHEISKVLPPTSSNPGIWQSRVEYSTRINSWHGTARFFGTEILGSGTARQGTKHHWIWHEMMDLNEVLSGRLATMQGIAPKCARIASWELL